MKEKNKVYTIKITSVTPEGDGIGRTESGAVVFVPLACSGETVEVKIIKETSNRLIGRIMNITEPSPDRTDPGCPVYRQCGGCSLRHMSYEAEKKLKHAYVTDCLKRIGGFDLTPEFTVSAGCDGYRNKAQYPLVRDGDRIKLGYYARHSHTVVPHTSCPLQPDCFGRIARDALGLFGDMTVYDEATGKGLLRHLFLRASRSGEVCVMPVINGNPDKRFYGIAAELSKMNPEVTSFFVNVNRERSNLILGRECVHISGKEYLTDTLCGREFRISPLSFWQVNTAAAEMLLYKARELAGIAPGSTVCDLYCGAGTVGLCVTDDTDKLFGIEIVPDAVENAKKNAAGRETGKTRFVCADSSEGIRMCRSTFGTPDVILTDPPRRGMSAKVIEDIAGSGAQKLVYISCCPSTLARDAALLARHGYRPEKAAVFDLFPRTSHVETVCLLSKLNTKQNVSIDLNMAEKDIISE